MHTRKIFVVDDDEPTRVALDSMLRALGYQVEQFPDGRQFLAKPDANFEGCIVLDVRMPGPSGLDIQRRLVDMGCSSPVIFTTGYGDIAMAVEAMKANALDFLTKPFREQDILDAIELAFELSSIRTIRESETANARRLVSALSPRENEIFRYLAQGRMNKQIAHDLDLSEATVKVHRRNILGKLKVESVCQLVLIAQAL